VDKQKGVEEKDEKDKREELGPEGNGPDRKGGPTTGVVVPGSLSLSLSQTRRNNRAQRNAE
jgi:hypothetical protein